MIGFRFMVELWTSLTHDLQGALPGELQREPRWKQKYLSSEQFHISVQKLGNIPILTWILWESAKSSNANMIFLAPAKVQGIDEGNDDYIFIMMQCLSVCLFVTKNHHFLYRSVIFWVKMFGWNFFLCELFFFWIFFLKSFFWNFFFEKFFFEIFFWKSFFENFFLKNFFWNFFFEIFFFKFFF